MEKLLQWSIANQSEDKDLRDKAGAPDPEQMARLFGAVADEPTLMKQNMSVITGDEYDLENKKISFDNFEMLIENLDNANNIENLKLWEPLLSQLDSPEVELRTFACSVVGTAVQNNPDSQNNCLKYDPMSKLIPLADTSDESKETQLKALYALSSLIRHNETGYKQFDEAKGWDILAPILGSSKSSDKLKLRTLSLLSAVLSTGIDDSKKDRIQQDKIVSSMLESLKSDGHIGCVDTVLNLLTQLAAAKYQFTKEEISKITECVKDIETIKEQVSDDDFQAIKLVVS